MSHLNTNKMFDVKFKLLKQLFISLAFVSSVSIVGAVESITYFHNDALGSPVAATDQSGNVLWREAYNPYGSRIRKEDNDTNDTWYTGKQEDKGTGLSYFGARWYNPVLGRFMGIDPIGFSEENIHSFNRYAYANNNPYKFVDPDGRDSVTIGYCSVICGEIKYQRKFSQDSSSVTEEFSAAIGLGIGGGIEANSNEGLSKSAARGDKFILSEEKTISGTASLSGIGVDVGGTIRSGNGLVDPGNKSLNPYGEGNGGSTTRNHIQDSMSVSNGKTGLKGGANSKVRFSFVTTRSNTPTSPSDSQRLAP